MTQASPENIHPALWRASQLGRAATRCVDTGYHLLNAQLPGFGWPTGNLVELLLQQPGIGEMRLLGPALSKAGQGAIMLIQPPHAPNIIGLAAMGLSPDKIIWAQPQRTADALWAAEHALHSGACGAVLLWQSQVRNESLRRLNLAAQQGETLFFMLRPLVAAQDASPSPLRLGLRPAVGGIQIDLIKRKGPQRENALFLPLLSPVPQPRPSSPQPARTPVRQPGRVIEMVR